jgi:hypothetical protein
MKYFFLVFLLLSIGLFGSMASAKSTKKQFHPNKNVRNEMNAISKTIRKLGPYIVSESEFLSNKNSNMIQKDLDLLVKQFEGLKAHPEILMEGLSLNQQVMAEQLKETAVLYKSNQRSAARSKFNGALNLCIGCHTQSPGLSLSKLFPDTDIEKMKVSLFEKAELNFISRDYEKALKLYDEYIQKNKKNDDDENLFLSLERQLIYFIKIKKSFPDAKIHFESYIKNKILSDKMAQEVGEWLKVLNGKSLWDEFNPQTTKEEEMEKFMNGFIADDEAGPIFTISHTSEVLDLNLMSILLDYYNAHPESKHGAKILYWLAILEKRVNSDLFFSMGDYYLLSCMEKYPKSPIAQDCYDAYEEEIESHYQTKGKKVFPASVIEKMNQLKKKINYVE